MRAWTCSLLVLVTLLPAAGTARADPAQDAREVEQTCVDFAEGYSQADAARIERAAHPNLVNRSIGGDPTTSAGLVTTTLQSVINFSKASYKPGNRPAIRVEVLDVFAEGRIATAKITTEYVDYAHLAKIDGRWRIVSLLWARR